MKNKIRKSKISTKTLKLISISISFAFSFFILEIISRIAPATDVFPLEKPLKCDLTKPINLKCLHRRKPYIKGTWSAGKFKAFNSTAFKETNDIGQFSDVDFKDFIAPQKNKLRVVSIGDSFVEALQVENKSTFHGRLNAKETTQGNQIISTSIGASGMAFPNYIASIRYLKNNIDLEKIVLVIPIISNDFDQSFEKYGNRGRRGGLGQFYFQKDSQSLKFKPFKYKNNFLQKSINFILKNSALSRYLIYNLRIGEQLKRNFIFLTNQTNNKPVFDANIIESSEAQTPLRYQYGKYATKYFLSNIKQLRKTNLERTMTIFVIDSNRENIYQNIEPNKYSFFEKMRSYFIKNANDNGFTVIDMQKLFENDYAINKKRFNSIYDGHWNEYGHFFISEKIYNKLNSFKF